MEKRILVENADGSVAVIIPTGEISIAKVLKKDVPAGLKAEIVDASEIPEDRTFRAGWKYDKVKKIGFDIDKCKAVTHGRRRAARHKEFTPHDEVIARQVPGEDHTAAETARTVIRKKYDKIQQDIDASKTPEELKAIVDFMG